MILEDWLINWLFFVFARSINKYKKGDSSNERGNYRYGIGHWRYEAFSGSGHFEAERNVRRTGTDADNILKSIKSDE